jgi:methyl-accepting chemotaxis protein
VSREVVLKIKAKSGSAADALNEVQAKIDEIKQSASGASGEVQETGSVSERAFDEVSEGAGKGAEAIDNAQKQTKQLKGEVSEMGARFQSSSVEFVSGAEAQEAAFAGVIQKNQRLQQELQETTSTQHQMGEASEQAGERLDAVSGPASEVGFILQDMQQFQFGAAEGFRAIGNNLPGLISGAERFTSAGTSLTSMLTGPGGLLIGVNALAGALPFLVSQLTEAEEQTEKSDEEIQDLTDSLREQSNVLQQLGGKFQSISEDVSVLESAVSGISVPSDFGFGLFEQGLSEQINLLQSGRDVRGQIEFLKNLQDALRGNSDEAKNLGQAFSSAGVDVQQFLDAVNQGDFEKAKSLIVDNADALDDLAENADEALARSPGAIAAQIEERANAVRNVQEQLAQVDLREPVEAAESELDVLEGALESVLQSDQFADQIGNLSTQFVPLLERIGSVRREVERLNAETEELPEPPDVPQVQPDSEVVEPDVSFGDSLPTPLLDVQQRIQAIKDQAKAGLISPLEETQKRASALRDAVVSALENGYEPSSDEVQELVRRLAAAEAGAEDTKKTLEDLNTSTQQLVGAARQFSSAIGNELGQQFNNLLTGNEQVQRLRERRADLQERLREAQASGDVEQARKLREQLSSVNDELDKASNTFRQFGQAAVQALQQVIAKLASAAILAGIVSAVTGGGFGSVFGTVLGGGNIAQFFAEGGAVSGPGTSTSDSVMARLSDGEFVVNAASFSQAPNVVQAINEDPSFGAQLEQAAGFAAGGPVSVSGTVPSFATGGRVSGRDATTSTSRTRLEGGDIVIPATLIDQARQQGSKDRSRTGRRM